MLIFELLNLNEVFDTIAPIKWKQSSGSYRGTATVGDDNIEIHIDEYSVQLDSKTASLLDFGFTKNGSWDLQPSGSSSKILGVVLNGLTSKVKELQPDMIMFGANNKNGSVASRMSLYTRIASMYSKGSKYSYMSPMFETPNGEYTFISRFTPTSADLQLVKDTAAKVPQKD